MATGIVNPYAVANENTAYRDAVLADSPLGLWMMDEPYGNNVATNQGSSGTAGNGAYWGNMQLATSRGLRTVFNIDVAGASYANSNNSLGFYNGSVSVPFNSAFNSNMATNYSTNTWEWVTRVDHQQTSGHYQWMIKRDQSENILGIGTGYNYLAQRLYVNTGGTDSTSTSTGTSNVFGLGQDKHHVVKFGFISGSGNYQTWYVNGVQTALVWIPSYLRQKVPTSSSMIFGSYYAGGGPSYSLLGAMGGVAYYDYDLPASRITAHYQALLT